MDPGTGVWTNLPPMKHRLGATCAVVAEDRLYVMGGFDGTHNLNTVERYDPTTKQWEMAPALTMERRWPAATGFLMPR